MIARPTEARRPGIRPGSREFTLFLAATMSMVALGIDLMLPAFAEIRAEFGLSSTSTDTALVVTTYFIGLAFAQILYGPVADRFGRKPALAGGLTIYLVGAVASALAPSLPVLLAARFVWGIGAAGPRVIVAAVVRDVYQGDRMARAMSLIFALFVLVPVFAPSVGALILLVAPWRWVFGFCAVVAVAIMAWSRRLPETLDPERRLTDLSFRRIGVAARTVVSNRVSIGATIALAFMYGVFASYLASSELMWADVFDIREAFPLVFGGIATFMGLTNLLNSSIVERFGIRRLSAVTMSYYVVASGGLMVWVISWDGRPPFWPFILVLATMLMVHANLFPNLNSRALEPMGERAGMASALLGTISTGGGAVIGAVVDARYDGTLVPFTVALFVAGLVAGSALLWGERAVGAPGRSGRAPRKITTRR